MTELVKTYKINYSNVLKMRQPQHKYHALNTPSLAM